MFRSIGNTNRLLSGAQRLPVIGNIPCRVVRKGDLTKSAGIGMVAVASMAFILPAVAGPEKGDDSFLAKRAAFLAAYDTRHGGPNDEAYWSRLAGTWRDYPLYPYLLYRRFDHFHSDLLSELKAFLHSYPHFPKNKALRSQWLESLASRGQWRDYLDLYHAADADVQKVCLALQARLMLGQTEKLIDDIVPVFLSGRSQPDVCDPLFAYLYASPSFNSVLLWQRIRLAFTEGQTGLASYLGRRLDADGQERLQQWFDMHRSPAAGLRRARVPDDANGRSLLAHGLLRLVKRNVPSAIEHWRSLSERYSFQTEEKDAILRALGRRAVIHRHPGALLLLDDISMADEETFTWRLQAALRNSAWGYLEKWTRGEPLPGVDPLQWNYWRARALHEGGVPEAARDIFADLAGERDYYGFMAADRLQMAYAMNHKPIVRDDIAMVRTYRQPAVQRAREWLLLDNLPKARKEWRQALRHSSADTLRQIASLAHQWGWHDMAISALGKAMDYDDLVIRFPLLYVEGLQEQAKHQQLDLSWLFGLVRAESLFVEKARSRAGALGLMQVMPATGRLVSRSLGWRNFFPNQLLQSSLNLRIGSAYLRQMYDEFGGNIVYATAAYNAGPNRVRRWHQRLPCAPADVWIEVIPFQETRKYVKHVLMNSSVYDWRLRQAVVPIRERLTFWQLDSCPVAAGDRSP